MRETCHCCYCASLFSLSLDFYLHSMLTAWLAATVSESVGKKRDQCDRFAKRIYIKWKNFRILQDEQRGGELRYKFLVCRCSVLLLHLIFSVSALKKTRE